MLIKQTKINIKGSEWTVKLVDEDKEFENADGYTDLYEKEITFIMDHLKNKDGSFKKNTLKHVIRHETVHAVLGECGLAFSCNIFEEQWALNEEMVDMIASQLDSINKAVADIEKWISGGNSGSKRQKN